MSLTFVTAYEPTAAAVIVYEVPTKPFKVVGVVPSVYVNDQGPLPVNAMETSGNALPAQSIPPPLTVAVGKVYNATLPVPLALPVQNAFPTDTAT